MHVEPGSGAGGVRLHLADGTTRDGDVAVLAPGPGAEPLLRDLGVELRLRPRLEQVVHLGDPGAPGATDGHGCLVDRPRLLDDGSETPNLYAMPTPGRGYKIGIDEPIRDLVDADDDRTPDEATTARGRRAAFGAGSPASGRRPSTRRCAAGRSRPTGGS